MTVVVRRPAAAPPRRHLSGWCSLTATERSHARCSGEYAGVPCKCVPCHGQEPK